MRVVHDPADGARRTLATDVEVADTWFSRGRGLMGRRSIPDDYALVFPFERAARRGFHTVLVPVAIDVVWTVADEVTRVRTMRPWIAAGRARADRVIEFAAGVADGVEAGDAVRVLDDGTQAAGAETPGAADGA